MGVATIGQENLARRGLMAQETLPAFGSGELARLSPGSVRVTGYPVSGHRSPVTVLLL